METNITALQDKLSQTASANSIKTSLPDYWVNACLALKKQDRILHKLILKYPNPADLLPNQDPFISLARTIVGQQISVKAAKSIWGRLLTACLTTCAKFSAEYVLNLDYKNLASCGLSRRKSEYLFNLAKHFKTGNINSNSWHLMDDNSVVESLTQIRGVGPWSAHMFLIFNLLRPNILPLDDLGLIKAISKNYFSNESVTRSEVRELATNWMPWCTVATWYLWQSLN